MGPLQTCSQPSNLCHGIGAGVVLGRQLVPGRVIGRRQDVGDGGGHLEGRSVTAIHNMANAGGALFSLLPFPVLIGSAVSPCNGGIP
jgi:hypothetical protein